MAFPEWLLANTRRNATAAHLEDDGLTLKDALPGVPFTVLHVACNFGTGAYFPPFFPGMNTGVHYIEPPSERLWSPDSMAGQGVR